MQPTHRCAAVHCWPWEVFSSWLTSRDLGTTRFSYLAWVGPVPSNNIGENVIQFSSSMVATPVPGISYNWNLRNQLEAKIDTESEAGNWCVFKDMFFLFALLRKRQAMIQFTNILKLHIIMYVCIHDIDREAYACAYMILTYAYADRHTYTRTRTHTHIVSYEYNLLLA